MLSLARVQGTTKLDLIEYGYDRLGRPAFMRRWAGPDEGWLAFMRRWWAGLEFESTQVTWTWTNDSLGNVLVANEPAEVGRRFTYDDWGNVAALGWTESTRPAMSGRSRTPVRCTTTKPRDACAPHE